MLDEEAGFEPAVLRFQRPTCCQLHHSSMCAGLTTPRIHHYYSVFIRSSRPASRWWVRRESNSIATLPQNDLQSSPTYQVVRTQKKSRLPLGAGLAWVLWLLELTRGLLGESWPPDTCDPARTNPGAQCASNRLSWLWLAGSCSLCSLSLVGCQVELSNRLNLANRRLAPITPTLRCQDLTNPRTDTCQLLHLTRCTLPEHRAFRQPCVASLPTASAGT